MQTPHTHFPIHSPFSRQGNALVPTTVVYVLVCHTVFRSVASIHIMRFFARGSQRRAALMSSIGVGQRISGQIKSRAECSLPGILNTAVLCCPSGISYQAPGICFLVICLWRDVYWVSKRNRRNLYPPHRVYWTPALTIGGIYLLFHLFILWCLLYLLPLPGSWYVVLRCAAVPRVLLFVSRMYVYVWR